jgi:hypothetical protein
VGVRCEGNKMKMGLNLKIARGLFCDGDRTDEIEMILNSATVKPAIKAYLTYIINKIINHLNVFRSQL